MVLWLALLVWTRHIELYGFVAVISIVFYNWMSYKIIVSLNCIIVASGLVIVVDGVAFNDKKRF